MDETADPQCQAILRGLQALETVLGKSLANEALDLEHDAAAFQQKVLLGRLRKSLEQYLERSTNLVYVGLIGHFSSGKSSTINSLLSLWGSRNERPTTLNPTDKVITLITHERNANSLLGILSQGSVPIRMQTIDDDFLNELVLADTPGTGDPHLIEEMARDFLPICDLVLFFFSAASPLDSTDIPLLTELYRRLPFIPLKFIVTRADELRIDPRLPLSPDNFDERRATTFVGEIMSRLALLPELSRYSKDDFLLIDNKAQFNVELLRNDLLKRSDPINVAGRIAMHSHKVSFFQTTSERLREFFSALLEGKLTELNRVVATAQKNILDYQEAVNITNNNLTKSWIDHQATIQDLQVKATERIKNSTDLPTGISNLEPVSKLTADIRSDITRQSASVSELIQQFAMQTGFLQLQKELGRVQKALLEKDLDEISAHDHGLGPINIHWTFGDTDVVPEFYLARRADELREKLRSQSLTLARETRKQLEEMLHAIQHRYVIDKCELIISTAQSSLMQDLDVYFQSVRVYHAGVFAMTTQESIAKLGIGRQMDLLLKDFTDEDKESIKLRAKQGLFPSFDDVVATATTKLAAIAEQVRSTLNEVGNPQIEVSSSQLSRIELNASNELADVLDDVKSELQSETNTFVGDLQDKLAGAIATTLIEYDKERSEANRARKIRYTVLISVMGGVSVAAYLLFNWVTRPVGPTLFEVLGWGMLIEIAGNFFGWGVARYKDKYPQKKREIKQRHSAILTDKVKGIINEAVRAHKFMVLQPTVLGKKLDKVYSALTFPASDAWQRSVEELYGKVRGWNARYKELRRDYLSVMEIFGKDSARYFEDHKKNLDSLKSTAQDIKERAIEPSFDLLAQTSDRLKAVKDEITAIRFS